MARIVLLTVASLRMLVHMTVNLGKRFPVVNVDLGAGLRQEGVVAGQGMTEPFAQSETFRSEGFRVRQVATAE
ncbi:hypothetical protein [Nonomuraea sp. NPDC049141]|uniref:hypothetical protein n=1 Tax=Nonomuraea sp. NPDC049141 TaxID=3155500 RepID=UPI0033F5A4B1